MYNAAVSHTMPAVVGKRTSHSVLASVQATSYERSSKKSTAVFLLPVQQYSVQQYFVFCRHTPPPRHYKYGVSFFLWHRRKSCHNRHTGARFSTSTAGCARCTQYSRCCIPHTPGPPQMSPMQHQQARFDANDGVSSVARVQQSPFCRMVACAVYYLREKFPLAVRCLYSNKGQMPDAKKAERPPTTRKRNAESPVCCTSLS